MKHKSSKILLENSTTGMINTKRAFTASKICGVSKCLASKATGVPHKRKLRVSKQGYKKKLRFLICNVSTFILVKQQTATSMETKCVRTNKALSFG